MNLKFQAAEVSNLHDFEKLFEGRGGPQQCLQKPDLRVVKSISSRNGMALKLKG
jgi:hypothetical protein